MWLLTALVTAVAACRTPAPPTRDPAPSPIASTSPVAPRCLATTARSSPAGWIETGTILIALSDGQPTAIEARDLRGRIIAAKPAPSSGAEAQAMIVAFTCELQGLLASLDGPAPPKQGLATATLIVRKPAVADEQADVRTLCATPTDFPADADESQKTAIAFQLFQEELTTARWRAWLQDLVAENRTTEGSARVTMRKRRADELHTEAEHVGVAAGCWFEAALRRAVH